MLGINTTDTLTGPIEICVGTEWVVCVTIDGTMMPAAWPNAWSNYMGGGGGGGLAQGCIPQGSSIGCSQFMLCMVYRIWCQRLNLRTVKFLLQLYTKLLADLKTSQFPK